MASSSDMSDRRFVVFDNESTGLNPRKDRLVSIGAVAVRGGDILLNDIFEATIRIDYNTPAVTVHGITRQQSMQGVDEAEAVGDFLEYLGGDTLVGHHVMFDYLLIEAATQRHFQRELTNRALDTMRMALALESAGAFGDAPIKSFDFDSLCTTFKVVTHDRHTASGDAYLTAQIFLKLLRLMRRHEIDLETLYESKEEA